MSLHVTPPLPMATQGLAFTTPPWCPAPLEGEQNAGRLVQHRAAQAVPALPRAVYAHVQGGGGRVVQTRLRPPRPRTVVGEGGTGVLGDGLDGESSVSQKKEGSGYHGPHTLPFWGKSELLQVFPFYMVK